MARLASAKTPSFDVFQKLRQALQEELTSVDQIILNQLKNRVALIPELAQHIISAGGKRLRPILTLASSRLCGYQGQHHLSLAACVEFIHTATLLHDDVVDNSQLRRGTSTANTLWGNQASVLVGDFLFSKAFQLMVESGNLEILHILSTAAATIAQGEVLQLMNIHDLSLNQTVYLEVIEAKTAALFAAACEIGGVLANKSKAETTALRNYGINLGILFQLVDDALDYLPSHSEHLGKVTGDDFREGKMTLPVIYALQEADQPERLFWKRTMADNQQEEGDLNSAIAILKRHDAIAKTLKLAQNYCERALGSLELFPNSPWRTIFSELAFYCISRANSPKS